MEVQQLLQEQDGLRREVKVSIASVYSLNRDALPFPRRPPGFPRDGQKAESLQEGVECEVQTEQIHPEMLPNREVREC